MSHNSFGHLFRVTTWGESHGPAIGCVVDGTPPRLGLTEAEIQTQLDRRKPGQSRFTTQRREPDRVQILSGVLEGNKSVGKFNLSLSYKWNPRWRTTLTEGILQQLEGGRDGNLTNAKLTMARAPITAPSLPVLSQSQPCAMPYSSAAR